MRDHMASVREFVDRASAVDSGRWFVPRAPGKWTPAQEVQHIHLAYGEFLRQLRETVPMRRRGHALRRIFARMIGLTSILWFKRIPVAVNAPREVRPGAITTSADDLLDALRRRTQEFDVAFATAWRTDPHRRMSHYLFGRLTLDQGIRLVAVHTRHHAAFLPSTTGSTP